MISLDFLENNEHFDRVDQPSDKQALYFFKSMDGIRKMKGIIGIPLHPGGRCWHQYYEEGRKTLHSEPLPPWFEVLVRHSLEYTEKKHRLKRIFS